MGERQTMLEKQIGQRQTKLESRVDDLGSRVQDLNSRVHDIGVDIGLLKDSQYQLVSEIRSQKTHIVEMKTEQTNLMTNLMPTVSADMQRFNDLMNIT